MKIGPVKINSRKVNDDLFSHQMRQYFLEWFYRELCLQEVSKVNKLRK